MKIVPIKQIDTDKRWKATLVYQVNDKETRTETHYVEEIADLQSVIEQGPHFGAIKSFKVEYLHEKTTIEKAWSE